MGGSQVDRREAVPDEVRAGRKVECERISGHGDRAKGRVRRAQGEKTTWLMITLEESMMEDGGESMNSGPMRGTPLPM
jgi:hypothetical protein